MLLVVWSIEYIIMLMLLVSNTRWMDSRSADGIPWDGAVHVYPMGYTSSWCCACIPPGVYIQMVLCMCTCTCTCAVPTSAHVQIRVFRGVHLLSTPKCLKGSHRVFTCLNTTVPGAFGGSVHVLWGVACMHIMCYASHDVHVFDRY